MTDTAAAHPFILPLHETFKLPNAKTLLSAHPLEKEKISLAIVA